MRIFLPVFIVILLFASCGQSREEIAQLLAQADSALVQHPDSTLAYLNAIRKPAGLSQEQRHDYYLLRVQAKDKTGQDISADTIITYVVDYYLWKKDFPKATLAAFYCGRVWSERKDDKRALQAYLEAAGLAANTTDGLLKGKIAHNTGYLYYATGAEYQKAIGHFRTAAGLFSAARHDAFTMASLKYLGTCFLLQKQADSALVYQQQALHMAMANHDTLMCADILNTLSIVCQEIGDNRQAKIYALQAAAVMERKEALLNLGFIYYNLNEDDSAAFYARRVEQLYEQDSLPAPISLYGLLAKIAKRGRQFEQALAYQEKYTKQIVELNEEEGKRSIVGIREKYDMTQVENENQRLQIQHLRLLFIALTGFMALAGVGGYLFYRSQRHKRSLALAKEENRKRYEQRMAIYKELILLERGQKKADRELHAGILEQVKQVVFNADEAHIWESIYSTINDQHHGTLDYIRQRFPELDETEFKIGCLTCAGFKNNDMALFLRLSIHTVKAKKVSLRKKIGIAQGGDIAGFITGKFAREGV
jgi:tetratricopeptide (TPR) repeat protein